jgi:hypothetical protein
MTVVKPLVVKGYKLTLTWRRETREALFVKRKRGSFKIQEAHK